MPGAARLNGIVVDASGGAIAGAVLSAGSARDDAGVVVVSDDAGHFQLNVAPGLVRVSARADGYSEQMRMLRAPLDGLRFVLAPASTIVGRVVAEGSGAPVAGVLVRALGEAGPLTAPRSERSSAEGSFRLEGLHAGRYSLVAQSEHGRSDELSIGVGVAEVTQSIEITLRAAVRLRGNVNVAGVPCQQGRVTLRGPVSVDAALAADGSVAFDGLTLGTYEVTVRCDGALPAGEMLEVGLTSLERSWTLEKGLRVDGIALTVAGAPLPRAHVDVYPVGEPRDRANVACVTDEHGEFSCTGLAPGEYDCTIGPGAPPRSDSVRFTAQAEPAPHILLHAHAESSIRVHIAGRERFELPALLVVAKQGGATQLGELNGDVFLFERLALGSYVISSDSDERGPEVQVDLKRPDSVEEVTLELPAPQRITGRVLDAAGQGVPDAWVQARGASPYALVRPATPVMTDGQGDFTVDGLVPGTYQLEASTAEGQALLEGVPAESRGVIIRLAPYGALSGSVSDAAGEPVGEFVLRYGRRGDSAWQEVVGTRGAWSLPWLPPGTYELTAAAEGGRALETVDLRSGADVTVALRIRPGRETPAGEL